MSQSKFETSELKPVYMSQAEANEVMAIWTELQREEAARQSLLTIHDVAEAIQVSPDQVGQILNQVRSKQPSRQRFQESGSPLRKSIADERLAFVALIAFIAAGLVGLGATQSGFAGFTIVTLAAIGILTAIALILKMAGRLFQKHQTERAMAFGQKRSRY